MWLRASLPGFAEGGSAVVARLHAAPGDRLDPGSPLLDLTVDLSAGIARDCPPVTTCRILLGETLWLRRMLVAPGDPVAAGMPLALLADAADTPEAPAAREARIATVAVIHHEDWWSDEA